MKKQIKVPPGRRTLNEKYIEKYRAVTGGDALGDTLLLLSFELDPEQPGKKVDGFCVFTADACTVYTDGKETDRFSVSRGGRYRMVSEIGGVFVEYLSPEGNYHFVCRAGQRYRNELGLGVKFLNRVVEYGEQLTFSDAPAVPDAVCPKCGAQYPSASSVCVFS